MIFIGVDPGARGAIAALATDGTARCYDLPRVGPDFDLGQIREILLSISGGEPSLAIVEWTHAMPPVIKGKKVGGSVANFNLGRASGIVEGALGALRIPYRKVAPVTWKRAFALIGQDKGASRACAAKLFPTLDFSRAKDDGRAEACLLARYGLDKFGGEVK